MAWNPIERPALEAIVVRDLAECSSDLKNAFSHVRIPPLKWKLSPWGDAGGGFWAVAVFRDRVLWYKDIEDGFNVLRYAVPGEIPESEYWCNEDQLSVALQRLLGEPRPWVTGSEPALGD